MNLFSREDVVHILQYRSPSRQGRQSDMKMIGSAYPGMVHLAGNLSLDDALECLNAKAELLLTEIAKDTKIDTAALAAIYPEQMSPPQEPIAAELTPIQKDILRTLAGVGGDHTCPGTVGGPAACDCEPKGATGGN